MPAPAEFFDLDGYRHRELFEDLSFVWEALPRIKPYINDKIRPNLGFHGAISRTRVLYRDELIDDGFTIDAGSPAKGENTVFYGDEALVGASVLYEGSYIFDENIEIKEGSVVEPGALIKGPTILGKNTEVRQGAYIRGNCVTGDNCIIGHATEMKSTLMFDRVTAGHFAYMGDSILGHDVNLGAGTKLANLNITGTKIMLRIDGQKYKTGLKKFGAVLGDGVETGCNSVTSPGTLMGKGSILVPNKTAPPGLHPRRSIIR